MHVLYIHTYIRVCVPPSVKTRDGSNAKNSATQGCSQMDVVDALVGTFSWRAVSEPAASIDNELRVRRRKMTPAPINRLIRAPYSTTTILHRSSHIHVYMLRFRKLLYFPPNNTDFHLYW